MDAVYTMRNEIHEAEKKWIRLTQETIEVNNDITLEKDGDGILRCVGRVKGYNLCIFSRKQCRRGKLLSIAIF